MDIIEKYFPNLSSVQSDQFSKLNDLYKAWNVKINVVSRKDINELYLKHVLHSLSIAKFIQFVPGTDILDVGTGGGFPGLPLAIIFPEVNFLLVDSIGKKINVVNAISHTLGLKNIVAMHLRAEKVNREFDFIVSRAVTDLSVFIGWVENKIKETSRHNIKNGILTLKGGDLEKELDIPYTVFVHAISDYFTESFFETKKIVHVPLPYRILITR